MIKYNLKCENDHEFESWFSNSNEFDNLVKKLEKFIMTEKQKKVFTAPLLQKKERNWLRKELI